MSSPLFQPFKALTIVRVGGTISYHPSIHLSIQPILSYYNPLIYLPIIPSIYKIFPPSIYSSIHPFFYPTIHLSIHPSSSCSFAPLVSFAEVCNLLNLVLGFKLEICRVSHISWVELTGVLKPSLTGV